MYRVFKITKNISAYQNPIERLKILKVRFKEKFFEEVSKEFDLKIKEENQKDGFVQFQTEAIILNSEDIKKLRGFILKIGLNENQSTELSEILYGMETPDKFYTKNDTN